VTSAEAGQPQTFMDIFLYLYIFLYFLSIEVLHTITVTADGGPAAVEDACVSSDVVMASSTDHHMSSDVAPGSS